MKQFEELIDQARSQTLSPGEKTALWTEIERHTHGHPARIRRGTVRRLSPYLFSHPFRYAAATALAISLVLVSVAEAALPGDILYPVKIQVTERIAASVSPTPRAKAAVQTALIERRLKEAEQVIERSSKDRVPPDEAVVAELTERVAKHVKAAHEKIGEIQQEDPETAVEASSELKVAIGSHKSALADIEEGNGSEDNADIVGLNTVLDEAASSTDVLQNDIEEDLEIQASSTVIRIASERIERLDGRIERAKSRIERVGNADQARKAARRIAEAETLADDARKRVSEKQREGLMDLIDSAESLAGSVELLKPDRPRNDGPDQEKGPASSNDIPDAIHSSSDHLPDSSNDIPSLLNASSSDTEGI